MALHESCARLPLRDPRGPFTRLFSDSLEKAKYILLGLNGDVLGAQNQKKYASEQKVKMCL